MTRAALSVLVSLLAVTLALATGAVQSQNHARAAALDGLKRQCDLIEARIQILEAETMRQRYALRYAYGERGHAGVPEH